MNSFKVWFKKKIPLVQNAEGFFYFKGSSLSSSRNHHCSRAKRKDEGNHGSGRWSNSWCQWFVARWLSCLLAPWSFFYFYFFEGCSLVYFPSVESGQEVYCEGWLYQCLPTALPPSPLSSVLTVFRIAAGSYRLTRLQPNMHLADFVSLFLLLSFCFDASCRLYSWKMWETPFRCPHVLTWPVG